MVTAVPVEQVDALVLLTGVAELSQEVEVLVQTGTETVHGQSVTVKVVLAVMV